jgi:hypothetical protein
MMDTLTGLYVVVTGISIIFVAYLFSIFKFWRETKK